ncbi:MAG: aminotransferase class V-fold PLP-dependent enzyme, partial [Alphaproteobacteria bacterium]|nr:aminotransferase class V-fold PLP-dependent enzyme [Alphaproteobacteria bacterium]
MNELISNQGHLFDIPRDVTYINCAYLSPLLQDVRAAGMAGIMRKVRPWTIMRGDFYDELEQARAGFARLIGASADDISVIPSTSYGAATAAVNLPLRSGQSVVLIEGEHGSNVRAWHVLAREREARVVTVARPGDSDWTAAILAAIDAATAIIALP